MFSEKKESGWGNLMGKGESSSQGQSLKNLVPTFADEPACAKMCPKLSYKQRIIGFVGCAGLGWILSLVGTLVLVGGATEENIRIFIALYVIGNFICLAATGFLLGPKAQCVKMWDPTRRFSTAFYLIMLIIVFAVAVAILAAVWYSASYIPYGRKMIITCLKKTICKPCFDAYESSKGSGGGSK